MLIHPSVQFEYAGLFEAPGSWIHPERVERTWEIIYVVRGEVHLTQAGEPLSALPGQVLLLPPGMCHKGAKPSENVRFYWVHFHLKEELPFARRHFDRFDFGCRSNRNLYASLRDAEKTQTNHRE